MLIEFRVENHRSLQAEQVLTFAAGRVGDADDTRPREVAGSSEHLLPVAVLYGANASGKSNVLSAISFMRDAVVLSHRIWDPDAGVPRTPFGWGNFRSLPSLFEATFVIDGTKFIYGFVVSDSRVEEEWLYSWPNGRRQIWFTRERDVFSFGDGLEGPNAVMKEVTRPNALFLSVATQHQHKQLMKVFAWFRRISILNMSHRRASFLYRPLDRSFYSDMFTTQRLLFPELESRDDAINKIRKLLHSSDTGVVNVKVVSDDDKRIRVMLKHQVDDENSWLDLEEESQGTQTLFRIAQPLLKVLEEGGILAIDELESSLHPLLALEIVRMFNCPNTNPKNAQLLFTTHDTNLLGTILGDPPLRRDQIWFAEKNEAGVSRIYPLTDFNPRKAENLERGYLQGRYGAIPFLGDCAGLTE